MLVPMAVGTCTGLVICPITAALLGNVPVPYEWIENQPESLRYIIFLVGAFCLFAVTSVFAAGVSSTILGFLFKQNILFLASLNFLANAIAYSSCIFDQSILYTVVRFPHWISQPMNQFYLCEILFLLVLCLSMGWFGSFFGRLYVLIRDSYYERYVD